MGRPRSKYPHERDGKLVCLECNRTFKNLGTHIVKTHGMLARDYKELHDLPLTMPLLTEAIRDVKRRKALSKGDRSFEKNFFTPKAVASRFKKGQTGHRRMSGYEKKKVLERIINVNVAHAKQQNCPVCRALVKHVESHLYNKHGLLKVNKNI